MFLYLRVLKHVGFFCNAGDQLYVRVQTQGPGKLSKTKQSVQMPLVLLETSHFQMNGENHVDESLVPLSGG